MTNINMLEQYRAHLLQYTYDKISQNDLHGAIDALMDMRELDAKIAILKELETDVFSRQK